MNNYLTLYLNSDIIYPYFIVCSDRYMCFFVRSLESSGHFMQGRRSYLSFSTCFVGMQLEAYWRWCERVQGRCLKNKRQFVVGYLPFKMLCRVLSVHGCRFVYSMQFNALYLVLSFQQIGRH